MLRHKPLIERGNSLPVTLEFKKKIDGNEAVVKTETREFSLNYFARSRVKVGA